MSSLALALVATSILSPSWSGDLNYVAAEDEFRAQAISRVGTETDWPFSVHAGYLLCTFLGTQKVVFFFESLPQNPNLKDTGPGERGALITLDPMKINLAGMGSTSVFARTPSLKEFLRRLKPYAALGESLCDQPPGTIVGPSEI